MKGLYPPFGNPRELPRKVLVVAPHPDDEVFGCGGMLALHAQQSAEVQIIVLSDGTAGDPDARELKRSSASLTRDVECWGLVSSAVRTSKARNQR